MNVQQYVICRIMQDPQRIEILSISDSPYHQLEVIILTRSPVIYSIFNVGCYDPFSICNKLIGVDKLGTFVCKILNLREFLMSICFLYSRGQKIDTRKLRFLELISDDIRDCRAFNQENM